MHIVVFITCVNKEEAQKITHCLLEKKLVACVNIAQNIESFFWWQGKIDNAKESLMIIKSKKAKLNKIIAAVRKIHSYTVPEIIALPIISGNKPYLDWIDASLR